MMAAHRPGPLEALVGYYNRMDDAEEPGWSLEKIGWCIIIDRDGQVVDVLDCHDRNGKKPAPRLLPVPASIKRTVGIAPNFLWDKTSYTLSRTAGTGKRTAQEHAAFVAFHQAQLNGTNDAGLVAFLRFLENWQPDRFNAEPFRSEMLDANIVFRLDGDDDYLHRRPAARRLAERVRETADTRTVFCLVTGERAMPARLHPSIKGVDGAQTAGASLVSFNLDAFCSYDHKQGDNAPTSEGAAFRYGAALNRLLTRNGPNRVRRPVGDATVVFWAEADDPQAARNADDWFQEALHPSVADAGAARAIGDELDAVARGLPLSQLRPDIQPGTRFHVLGLSPNAARLSVRFWQSDSLDAFARRLAAHYDDMRMEPSPWARPPDVNLLLAKTVALQEKFENIPPLLAGEVLRAILAGSPYPRSWLAATLMRLRAGDD
ncbi:type I-C CRISPR-associated protein Cas8c/Csd1, partial [Nguyenibacter vanlangensis]